MPPLSVVIIARNEEDRIGEAIKSVAFADEVVVLDSGSSDSTVALARALGARVVETDWPGHVAQKNRALVYASSDWILSIDADERVSPTLAASVQAVMAQEPTAAGFRMSRLSWWMGAPVRHGTWYPDRRIRLFNRRYARWVGIDPHDQVAVEGEVAPLEGDILHHPYRDLSEHLATIASYTARHVEVAVARGVRARWWDVVLRPPLHFVKSILLKGGFRDGIRGWCIAGLGATYVLVKWTRLYLHQEQL